MHKIPGWNTIFAKIWNIHIKILLNMSIQFIQKTVIIKFHTLFACYLHITHIPKLGWPYGPFLRDAPLPGFLYCLKYPGFGCLHCAGRSFFDRCAAMLPVKWTNKHVRIFASLGSCRSHLLTCSATIGQLCTIPACYWSNYWSMSQLIFGEIKQANKQQQQQQKQQPSTHFSCTLQNSSVAVRIATTHKELGLTSKCRHLFNRLVKVRNTSHTTNLKHRINRLHSLQENMMEGECGLQCKR